MQIKNIANWNFTPQMEGLLFFANLIDEMTFNYTLDSFKASVHNVFSLMRECIETIDDIQEDTIRKGSLPPIVEEIKDGITRDIILSDLIQSNRFDLLIPKIDGNTPSKELKLVLEMFLTESILKEYNEKLKTEIANLIKANSRQKEKVEKLSRLFVAQMKFMGYPNASIYKKNKDFFFGRAAHIQNENDIDSFLGLFDFTRQNYSVCLFGNHLYSYLATSLQQVQITITDNFNLTQWDPSFAGINRTVPHKGQYIIIEIEAMDEYHAYEQATRKLTHFTSLFSFYHHKDQFRFIRNECIVRRIADGVCFKLGIPASPMMACEDTLPTRAVTFYQQAISQIKMEKDSFERFTRSVRLHDSAIRSNHAENQFLNLFTSFEVLIPKMSDLGKDRIVQITDIVIPYLCHNHFQKIVNSFIQDFRQWNNTLYLNILGQITDGNTDEEKIAALISLSKYDPQRSQIMTDATAVHYYLLRYRLWKLNSRMGTVQNVKSTFKRYEERMRWHITRLYRTRNLIVHAGAHPVYLDMLLENIHSFYDAFMKGLLSDITTRDSFKLEYSYLLRGQRYSDYTSYLEGLDNNVVVDDTNFLKILGMR